jgi:uncharacterized phiE125 gp8 family phage protein
MTIDLINKPRYSIEAADPKYKPVTVEECKDILEISDNYHDAKIGMMLSAALAAAENYTGSFFAQRVVSLYYDQIQYYYRLPVYPVVSITSIEYLSNDVYTAFTDYEVDLNDKPPLLRFKSFPSADFALKTLKITLLAGYTSNNDPADSGLIPDSVKQAILFHVYQSFLTRGELSDLALRTFKSMLHPYRVLGL